MIAAANACAVVQPRCSAYPESLTEALTAELLELEHRGWQSLCNGDGAEFYGQLMTEDGVIVLAHGYAFVRDAVIASLEYAPRWDSFQIHEPRAVPLGPDQAILRYTGTGRRRGEPDFLALMGSVYVRLNGV